ncbi:hypothetical protein TNCV_3200721 [Trichonephila clavipes]|nr:hypothetical protein TNCV_3200721 [Trichonephila clavipes]
MPLKSNTCGLVRGYDGFEIIESSPQTTVQFQEMKEDRSVNTPDAHLYSLNTAPSSYICAKLAARFPATRAGRLAPTDVLRAGRIVGTGKAAQRIWDVRSNWASYVGILTVQGVRLHPPWSPTRGEAARRSSDLRQARHLPQRWALSIVVQVRDVIRQFTQGTPNCNTNPKATVFGIPKEPVLESAELITSRLTGAGSLLPPVYGEAWAKGARKQEPQTPLSPGTGTNPTAVSLRGDRREVPPADGQERAHSCLPSTAKRGPKQPIDQDQPKLEQSIQQDHPNDQDPATDVNPAQTPYHDISIQGPYLTLAFPLQALFKCPVSAKPEIGLPVDSPSRGTSRPFIRSRQLTPTSSASYANSPSPRCRHRTLASRRHYSWQNATSNQSGNVASVVSASHQKLGLTTMSSPTRKHLLRRTTSQLKSGPRRAPSVKTGRKKVQKLSKGNRAQHRSLFHLLRPSPDKSSLMC